MEIQSAWSSCKVINEEGLPNTYEEMRKYFPIYEEAVIHILLCNCSTLNFLIYEKNSIFFFISVIAMLSFYDV